MNKKRGQTCEIFGRWQCYGLWQLVEGQTTHQAVAAAAGGVQYRYRSGWDTIPREYSPSLLVYSWSYCHVHSFVNNHARECQIMGTLLILNLYRTVTHKIINCCLHYSL